MTSADLPVQGGHRYRRDLHPRDSDNISLVLSGGGAKNSFEVGALEYLTALYPFKPTLISGTSMGSICAVQLAQAKTAEDFTRLVGELAETMVDVADPSLVFEKAGWFKRYENTSLGELIDHLLATQTATRPPSMSTLGKRTYDVELMDSMHVTKAQMLMSFLRHPINSVRLVRDIRSLPHSFLTMAPLERSLRGEMAGAFRPVDEAAVAASGIKLRMTVTALRAGTTQVVTEDGIIIDAYENGRIEGSGHPGVIEGALASGTIPVIFEPRQIGDDYYIDGGAIRNLPVGPARRAGAVDVIAISASHVDPEPIMWQPTEHGFLNVLARAKSITATDSSRRSALEQPTEGFRMTLIQPTMTPVGVLETARQLLQINREYGWLRAAETIDGDPSRAAEMIGVSDMIVNARELCYFLEGRLLEHRGTTRRESDELRADLDVSRASVREYVAKWLELGLAPPPGIERWGVAPEFPGYAEPAS